MFDEKKLKDPGYFRENRLDPHADYTVYRSEAEADAGVSSLRMSLNGQWKFFYARNPKQVVPGFEQPDYDCSGWADITVPAAAAASAGSSTRFAAAFFAASFMAGASAASP